jgi:pimeloyl-ACP methyl ester carboxylesterase
VHGAWHGGWCWERLVLELEARGHSVVAPDLPCEDVEAGVSVYAAVVSEALGDATEDVVLVGHSLGGITIPLVAARRPVRRLVYLCALVARPGRPVSDAFPEEPSVFAPGFGASNVHDELGRSSWSEREAAIEQLYGDAPRDLAEAAFARLRRQAQAPSTEPCPLDRLPDVPCTYVLATEDRAISPEWSRHVAHDWLGVEPIELPGSHSPFLSRPAELAELLASL